jgi:hypothetical protein
MNWFAFRGYYRSKTNYIYIYIGSAAQRGLWPPHSWDFSITHNDAPQSVWLLCMRDQLIAESQRPLPGNTQHSQETDIHVPGGIRTNDLKWRAAMDLRLRPCGHWDLHEFVFTRFYVQVIHLSFSGLTKSVFIFCLLILQFWPRFTAQTFDSSHAVGFGSLHGRKCV